MGMGCGRLRLAAFAVLAAGQWSAWAGPQDSQAVYWAQAWGPGRTDQAAFIGGARGGRRIGEDDVRARQIDQRATPPVKGAFEAWYCRRAVRVEVRPALCRRFALRGPASPGDPLLAELGEEAAPVSVETVPINGDAPPVVYVWKHRRKDWRDRRAELAVARPCRAECEHYAGVLQGGTGSGANIASIVQSGPNAAIIAQQVNGSGSNIASVGQWGACNQALVAQAAANVSNVSLVNQAGYKNVAVVLQH